MDWTEFALAVSFFFASHAIPMRPLIKRALVSMLGASGFTGAYSLLSIAALWWVINAAARAPFIELWAWTPAQNLVPLILMIFVFALIIIPAGKFNPFSINIAGLAPFDPGVPGLIKWVRHPILMAFLIWSLAHIVPNGNLAHVVVFAAFGLFALLGMRLLDRRRQREMGFDAWSDLVAQVRNSKASKMFNRGLLLRAAITILVYLVFLIGHNALFGVSPLP